MKLVATREELRAALAEARARGGARVGLVPTMGYLHEGHLSLVDRARSTADTTVLSIFVNPLQFGPGEDLAAYPRSPDRDLDMARDRGVDIVFHPAVGEMYPAGEPVIRVLPTARADRLCGAYRPGHFEGVLTVVAKLFNIVGPDVAIFGQKDYQQATLIRRMVRDLDFRVEIDVAPVVRESDGLAMSSRNSYLSSVERSDATALSRALNAAAASHASGQRDASRLLGAATAELARTPTVRLQYLELVHPETLDPVETASPGDVIAVAAFVGRTRLIDNVILS